MGKESAVRKMALVLLAVVTAGAFELGDGAVLTDVSGALVQKPNLDVHCFSPALSPIPYRLLFEKDTFKATCCVDATGTLCLDDADVLAILSQLTGEAQVVTSLERWWWDYKRV
jgi:hypothetical protein